MSYFKTSRIYDDYWRFAAERQQIFIKRNIEHENGPWTQDKILQQYKFTNPYRVNDRVSQFLVSHVIYNPDIKDLSEKDVLFRILLFKIFNKIETWKRLEKKIGLISLTPNIFTQLDGILEEYEQMKVKIYSGAYIMPSGKSTFGYSKKYKNHLALLQFMFLNHFAEKTIRCKTMRELYELLLSYPTIGSFLAYQYATDINYSEVTNFSEMEFVVPGPGAKSGIQKCFTDVDEKNYSDIIKYVTFNQEKEFNRLGLQFTTLKGRPLQLIDCQNLFCEFDKYSRVAFPDVTTSSNRTRIKQRFHMNPDPIKFYYPPKWDLNEQW